MCKVDRMRNCLLVMLSLGCAAGCGDNSKECGPGTEDKGGYCVPTADCGFGTKEDEETGECIPDGSIVCNDGTVFDPLTGTCKIDPAACGEGTVLFNNMCVDPTVALTIDVQEGPEPNGLGIVEDSLAQAGNITLKPAGSTFVAHGKLEPFRDVNNDGALDPDVDTFVITVGGPVLLRITADGVHGITAGFVAIAAVDAADPLADWRRFGINLVGDTSKRQVLLPKAGTYRLAIGDARSLDQYLRTGTATAAPPPGDYYVSLVDLGAPMASALAVTNGTATATGSVDGETIQFYAVPMGTGLNAVTLQMPSDLADASVVVVNNNQFRATDDETSTTPARVVVGGVSSGDTTLVAVDNIVNVSPAPAAFTLTVTTSSATPLSTTGGTATAPPGLFSLDVSAADASLGIQLMWSAAVSGHLVDDVGQRAAVFTNPMGPTWSTFRGVVRLAKPGRYYFNVAASAASLTATSTIVELTAQTVDPAVPLATAMSTVSSDAFAYAPGATAWHQFNVTGTNTGGQLVQWFDPTTAYGRLDTLATSGGTVASEVAPVFAKSFAATGGAIGRVVLDDAIASYYIKASAVSPGAGPMITLDFAERAASADLGTITSSATKTGETIDPTTPARFYVFRAALGKTVTITITPTSNVNTQFRRLRADETALGSLINDNNGPDIETFTQAGSPWTAFVVSASGALSAAQTFDVSVVVQ
jgi:hypothetical protein